MHFVSPTLHRRDCFSLCRYGKRNCGGRRYRRTFDRCHNRSKGGSAATASDIDGNYSLQVPDLKTAVLKVSYVGYLPQEIKVNGRSTVDVTLQTNAEQLEEVVVVGYSQQKESLSCGCNHSDNR